MTTILFANPTAQSGRARDLIDRARGLLRQAGIEHDFAATLPAGATVEWVRAAIDHHGGRRVIYLGGDGTFADVAKGILTSAHPGEVVMGLLPLGTANDQGKSLGLEAGPAALPENVRIIARGAVGHMDVGRFERLGADGHVEHADHLFDSASIGFSAAVLRRRNRDRSAVSEVPLLREIYRDQLLYAGSGVAELLDSYTAEVKFDVDALLDGRRHTFRSVLDVIINNTRVFGGEWVLAQAARHDDGLFELIPITGRRDFASRMLTDLRSGLFGGDTSDEDQPSPVAAATMDLHIRPHPGADLPAVQIDGEEQDPGDHFRIRVLPRALRLIVP